MRTPLVGVISAITPFNHPLNLVSHKLALRQTTASS
ncbi:aldehyde dehydrogenase family protein [Bradyrhizobium sp. 164]|nr:aldehyde dehydrogenase family protein [Bradyrhizobium sp. 164]